jgi:hypothetical protein
MSETSEIHDKVTNIVNNISKDELQPKIVNKSSNFVVVTYWWGRNNINRNTARPCGDYYEDYIKKLNKFMVNLLYTSISRGISDGDTNPNDVIETIFINLKDHPEKFPTLMDMIHKMVKHYMRKVCDYYKLGEELQDPCRTLFYKDKSSPKKTPPKQISPTNLFKSLYDILIEGIIKNKSNLVRLNQLQTEYDSIKAKVLTDRENKIRQSDEILNKDLAEVRRKQSEKIQINKQLIDTLKDKSDGKSIMDKLISLLEYKKPIKFEQMIDQWKADCEKYGCNHLSVEYSEFTKKGGYQLAINAKPKFIQKALKLCHPRGVLYIDGDMNIRSYPGIFDIDNVDYMARGWWIDPRSNWKMTESIMYDPYNFETSGGTMFFANTNAANKLLHLWKTTAENPVNAGKADDRVLSLVFNSKSVLTWLRIIQLPIEYLWLSLDYDERMSLEVYDYDIVKMKSTILIDHPECLTSEDTATGAGASNDRQPKFYDFLEDVYPCVETTHEYIMFKTLIEKMSGKDDKLTSYMKLPYETKKTQAKTIKTRIATLNTQIKDPSTHAVHKEILKKRRDIIKVQQNELLYLPYFYWYYHYMGGIQYLNDGNGDLYDLGFVDPEDEEGEDNSQPLSIISYKDRFGNNPHPSGEGLSVNKIVDINIDYAIDPENEETLITNANVTIDSSNPNLIQIIPNNDAYVTNKSVIQLLLKFLLQNKNVLINPKHEPEYKPLLYNYVIKKYNSLYKDIDFIFYPQLNVSMLRSSFYKPKIFMNQVMLFKPEQRLIDFISMQLSLEELSLFIYQGSYEFMSLVRIAYLTLKNQDFTPSPMYDSSTPNQLTPSSTQKTLTLTPSSQFETSSPTRETITPSSQITGGNPNSTPSKHNSNQLLENYFNTFEELFDTPKYNSMRVHNKNKLGSGVYKRSKKNCSQVRRKKRSNTKAKSNRRSRRARRPRRSRNRNGKTLSTRFSR